MRSESLISAGRSPQFRVSSDEPLPFVDIEHHQAFVPHFQEIDKLPHSRHWRVS
jgi:hypothetical protein